MPGAKGKSHKKLPKEKRDEVQVLVSKLLAIGKTSSEVKRMIENEYGMARRSVEPYLRRAREAMRGETGKSIEDLRAESYAFYTSILSDPGASPREKLKARELIDKLLGLPKPVMIHNKNLNVDLDPKKISDMSDDELADYQSHLLNSD